ncbi:MAG TPA: hypothetical protein VF695_02405 [Sphingomonas sp.]|jgi:hypothetical protein
MRTLARNPNRLLMRPGLVIAVALAAATSSADALGWGSGQGETTAGARPAPAGWRHSVDQGVDTYQKGDATTDAVIMVKEVPATTAAEVDTVTARIFAAMGCSGPPPASRDGSVEPFGERARCFASVARSPGGHRIAVGIAVTPELETEGVRVARRLAGADKAVTAAPPPPPSETDARTDAETDAALRAALDGVPKANIPVNVTLRRRFRYAGDHMQLEYVVWLLFANGFATSCMEWDPAVLAPTPQALASVEEGSSCEIARWRRVGNDAVFDNGEKGDTSLDDNTPPARGTTYVGDFTSTTVMFSSLMNYGVPGALRMDSAAMSLTRDGRFRLGSAMYYRNNLNSETTRQPVMAGRYMVDRYLIAFAAANGTIERHFFLATGKPDDKELILYLDGKLLSNR